MDELTSDHPNRSVCELESGRLEVVWSNTVDWSALGDAPIFGFAERNNPRRAFLFVSKVLGRHIPVAPAVMRAAFTALAQTIPDDLPGPVIITGMAETAVGLGAGVHDAWLQRTGRDDTVFLSTTRARLEGPLLATFREEHSHASDHLVHQPQHQADRQRLTSARSLVMIDDEASSGDTFRNLASGLLAAGLDQVGHIHTAVLTDWSGKAGRSILPHRSGLARSQGALVTGRYAWHPNEQAPSRTLPDADYLRQGAVRPRHRADDGRLGRSTRSKSILPGPLLASLPASQSRILVIGTGEHVWEPFLLAEALEAGGHDVRFGATTRSPILPGHAIRRGFTFRDHEGLGITNYLYNVDPAAFDRVIVCVDTAVSAIDPALLVALGADVMDGEFFHDRFEIEALTAKVAAAPCFVVGSDP